MCLSIPNSDLRKLLSKCLPGLPKEQGGKPGKKILKAVLPTLGNWDRPEGEQFLKDVTECEEKLEAHLCSELFLWQLLAGNSSGTGSGLPLSASALVTFVDSHLLDAVESSWQPLSCLLVLPSSTWCLFCYFADSMPNKLSWPKPTTQWL